MSAPIKLASGLTLPIDAVTQVFAFLGRRGTGKSYAAQKLAEEMLTADAQIVAFDPVGNWWGLRLKADGSRAGFEIPVFGGLHGDEPLEPTGGALLADIIADHGISAVLDVSQMLASEQARFAYDFATRFFQRRKAAPAAVHLFLEECQEFVPQNLSARDGGFEAKMLHAFERIVKLGRNFGIGCSLISQRPQEVNKKVLNLAECLLVFQMTGPQERKTIQGWVTDKGLSEDLDKVLPYLKTGEPHVWSPQWLQISKTVHIAAKRTYDASSTPTVGAGKVEVRPLSPLDMAELRAAMAATRERAKAEDPKELRKRIAELERQVKTARPTAPMPAEVRVVEVPAMSPDALHDLEETVDRAIAVSQELRQVMDDARHVLDAARALADDRLRNARRAPATQTARPAPARTNPPRAAARATGPGEALPTGERKVLTVLAQYPEGRTKVQVAILTGYAHSGGGFNNYLSALRSKQYITGGGDSLTITDAGLSALGEYEPLPTGRDLLDYWFRQLGKAERLVLEAVVEAYPRALSKEEAAARAGYEASGGGFNNALSRLRTLELISGRGELCVNEELVS